MASVSGPASPERAFGAVNDPGGRALENRDRSVDMGGRATTGLDDLLAIASKRRPEAIAGRYPQYTDQSTAAATWSFAGRRSSGNRRRAAATDLIIHRG